MIFGLLSLLLAGLLLDTIFDLDTEDQDDGEAWPDEASYTLDFSSLSVEYSDDDEDLEAGVFDDDFDIGDPVELTDMLPVQLELTEVGRGAVIHDFDPTLDVIEVEYLGALPTPDITVETLPDEAGANIAVNGVVVASLLGVVGVTKKNVELVAVKS